MMKASIEVADKRERDAIKRGLEDPAVRAFVVVMGVLLPLSKREQTRVMTYIADKFDEQGST